MRKGASFIPANNFGERILLGQLMAYGSSA
jgi:hypothetical protein